MMLLLFGLIVCVVQFGPSNAQTCQRSGVDSGLNADPHTGIPCPATFTYKIQNMLSEPSFQGEQNITIVEGRPLIWYMERASKKDPTTFSGFSLKYFPQFGYFIQGINGLVGNFEEDQTYWSLSNSNGPLNVGVSNYLPANGDVVMFDFVKSTHTG